MNDSELEKAILQYLRRQPRATTDAIAHGIGRGKAVTQGKVTELFQRGQIEDSGFRRVCWQVTGAGHEGTKT